MMKYLNINEKSNIYIVIILVSSLFLLQCSQSKQTAQTIAPIQITTSSGLVYKTIRPGSGEDKAENGDEVSIHETTSYLSGKLLFSSIRDMGPLLNAR